jgi:hypothetical protein
LLHWATFPMRRIARISDCRKLTGASRRLAA